MSVNSTDPLIGRLLDGRYQIRSRIARGGMATVYVATDLRLERRVAIKVMHGHLTDDSQFRDRFIQEARSAARLAHPNVVNVFDQGQDSDMAYLVMEYLPGITLRDLLVEHHLLTTEQTFDIMEAVLAGLAAAHKAGIVHRDLKPENVLLADDGRIKIGDFGLARAASANTATGAALLGTIAYLSPELVTRGVADARSDIYAAGIMMYEMLVGEQPFKGEQPMQIAYQHANDSVPAPSRANPNVPRELDDLVVWATAREPDDRPRDARVLLDKLFETHSAMMAALPVTAGTSTARTMVMPTAAASAPVAIPVGAVSPTPETYATAGTQVTAETQVIGARGRMALEQPPARSSLPPAGPPARRKRRRGWLVVLIALLLAAASAGVGWYFVAGPGSRVAIPSDLSGSTQEEATTRLEALGFSVNPTAGEINDPDVELGRVASTNPAPGTALPPGSEIQLLLSIGPSQLAVPTLVGLLEDQATSAITTAAFTLAEPVIRQFDAEIPVGIVLDALGADGSSLVGVATYGERQAITLVVSAGAIPDVVGMSVEDATLELGEVGLTVGAIDKSEFSDEIPEGSVIRASPVDDAPVRVDGVIDLITSLGIEPIEVPDVVGLTWAEAKPLLVSAGFELDYNFFADAGPQFFTVTSLDPDGGELAPKGSRVRVSFSS